MMYDSTFDNTFYPSYIINYINGLIKIIGEWVILNKRFFLVLIVFTFVIGLIFLLPLGIAPNINGSNYKNVTVRTQVNITNSKPEVLNVTVSEAINISNRNITLNAGGTKDITCNATLRDWNGYSDIIYVNSTLWYVPTSSSNATDDNSTHYTNTNCTTSGNGVGYLVNYLCNFTVIYYANNGTWNCNVTAMDNPNATGYGNGTTVLYPVYALNITDGIDYGGVAVESYSGNTTANITNLGNMAINITVEGYGGKRNDGLAMNCSLGGNITVNNERFSVADTDWNSRTPLNGSSQMLPGLTIPKQINNSYVVNSTYWQIYINSTNNPGGNCTGYVIFTAVAP